MDILVASLLVLGTMTACNSDGKAEVTSAQPVHAQSLEQGTIVEIATFAPATANFMGKLQADTMVMKRYKRF